MTRARRSSLMLGCAVLECAALGLWGWVPDARAQGATTHARAVAGSALVVEQGSGRLVGLAGAASNVFVADPNIIAVRPASSRRLFVFGKAAGFTTLTATDAAGRTIASYHVTVSPNRYPAVRIRAGAARIAPGSPVSVQSEANGVVVRGSVPTAAQDYVLMKQAQLAAGPGQTVLNDTEIVQPQQVALKVRIAQMSRTVTQQLGINWQSAAGGVAIGKFAFGFSTLGSLLGASSAAAPVSGSYNLNFPQATVPIDGILDALNTDNLAHILAEPTLTALSGQSASFIDGGSFPVPVPGQNGQVTVEYQNYGVQLKFKPVVLSNGSIILHVEPTVSSPTTQSAFQISVAGESIVVPSLSTQSASTTVVIGSGQTLAIAGLLSNSSNQTDNAVPGLGQIPVFGAAFRNDNYNKQEEELVILVTPYLVHPVDNESRFETPDSGWSTPNQIQRIFLFRTNGSVAAAHTLPGQAGFMLR
ncbi:type II and III secretion system protein family protein [Acidiphilium acidophilum]|uniref:Type II and III secretion system protein family protein n=1 Tax=Acidiphilium acidophilum TaxID=76588 RepID=A0AAW9DPW9_ACIAO|nr:type II and III secretion system protein family protein [Acidiphilium acidophilum]MDX5930468.1 type II and III secretion system protein family protein [Acidiphilium acidophilum]